MKIKMIIEIDLDDAYGTDSEDLLWLENEILIGNGDLVLNSNDVGDVVGIVRKVSSIEYITTSHEGNN